MPPRKKSKALVAKTPTAQRTPEFKLPFDCQPEYILHEAVASPDAEAMPYCYGEVHILILPGVPDDREEPDRHCVCLNDYVLLRPSTNSSAPFVGRLVALFRLANTAKAVARARIQWFYRPSDVLGSTPGRPYAEDEVLQTPHYNDVDVDTIVGRCSIVRYFGEHNDAEYPKRERREPLAKEKGDAQGSDADYDDAGSDESDFADNYESASTRLTCRDYYDACANMTSTAAFDDSDADPAALIAAAVDDGDSDDDGVKFDDEMSVDSSVEDSDADDVKEEDENLDGNEEDDDANYAAGVTDRQKRKRKRQLRTARHAKRKSSKTSHGSGGDDETHHNATQFCLPADIGMGDEELPCRDVEKRCVLAFLETVIRESAHGADTSDRCLYISGVPGTGKTATVREIVGKLRTLLADGNIPPFDVVEVNGMSTPDPSLVYSQLYSAVVGKRGVPHARAQQLLQARFQAHRKSNSFSEARGRGRGRGRDRSAAAGGRQSHAREQGKCVILILDEMDVLVSRKEQVLYDLLEWTTQKDSRLAVIGIANTMDLPERLMPKIKSRMGDNRLVYEPYTRDELMKILEMRLRTATMPFQEAARRLVAAKVAAISGDVRRALQLCRRATEVAEAEYKQQDQIKAHLSDEDGTDRTSLIVTVNHVNSAVNEMTGGSRLNMIKNLAVYERLVLVCVLALSRSTGTYDVDVSSSLAAVFKESRSWASSLPKIFPFGAPTMDELESVVARLVTLRVVLVERAIKPLQSRIVVNLSPEDCSFALMDDPIAKAVLHGKKKRRPRAD
jgi:Cdc6-like AAA superfamily ATPase